jgi:IS1 family transposase
MKFGNFDAKQKNVPNEKEGQFGYGDVWTWVAIDPETKLVISWCIGSRGAKTARDFMHDLAGRLANRVQLTTDGHRVYLEAVENAFRSPNLKQAIQCRISNGSG